MREPEQAVGILIIEALYAFFSQLIASICYGISLSFIRVSYWHRCRLSVFHQLVDGIGQQSGSCGSPLAIKPSSCEPVVSDEVLPLPDSLISSCDDDDAFDEVTAESDITQVSASCSTAPCTTDLSLVESVQGLQELKVALASNFVSDPNALPQSFRKGYIVDLNQHWISVHAIFEETTSILSLIVFDTLEVNYQAYHEVGLLRSAVAESSAAREFSGKPSNLQKDDMADVATLCKMRGIQYDISFLAPICDMRRLTFEEEDQIRKDKKAAASKSTIYYDQCGNPFRRIIVQPILQSTQDGTCKSRALAVLGWLLKLDEKALGWYVCSNRELFQVELRAARGGVCRMFNNAEKALENSADESHTIFGSLMSSGRRDKFGRDVHMKVCHLDTLRYNQQVGEIASNHSLCQADASAHDALIPSDSQEVLLQQRREEELKRIQEVLICSPRGELTLSLDDDRGKGLQTHCSRQWRSIEDHDARWNFLEETCFFGHNLGYKKIKKMYPRDDILDKEAPSGVISETSNEVVACADNYRGFGETKYLRKYMVSGQCENYITHEADPIFHKPLENFLGFLCCKEQEDERVTVPFYVLPFPGDFTALSLDSHVNDTTSVLALQGDPEWHSGQIVSDYSLPTDNTFLNDPISYNKSIASVSLPIKLCV
jgi:hypothetical protein